MCKPDAYIAQDVTDVRIPEAQWVHKDGEHKEFEVGLAFLIDFDTEVLIVQ